MTTASPRSLYYKPIYYLSISVRIKKIIQCIYNTFISKLYQTHGKISRCTFFYIPSTDNLQYPVCIIHFFRTLSIGECALDDNFGVSGNNPVNKLILHDTYWRNYNDVLATSRIYIKRWGVKHLDINLQREDGKKDNVTPSNTNLTFKYAPKDFDCAVFNWNTCIDCVNVIKFKKKISAGNGFFRFKVSFLFKWCIFV